MKNTDHLQPRTLVRALRGPASWLIAVSAAVTLSFVGACGSEGSVGESCSGDSDCGYGLQCFQPYDAAVPLCTISCADSPCAQGICIKTLHGDVCASPCAVSETPCREDLKCQVSEGGDEVCWYPDTTLDELPEGLMISRVEITEDTNMDGFLNPGETAVLNLYGQNLGVRSLEGVWAQLDNADPMMDVQVCKVPAYPQWLTCTAACSCHAHAMQSIVTATAGKESAEPVLSMHVQVSDDAEVSLPIKLTVHDSLGRSWQRDVDVPITEPEGSVHIHDVTLIADGNSDGSLSPGETGSVAVRVKNSGVTQVRGLWTSLASIDDGVEVLQCYAGIGNNWMACDAACSCELLEEAAKPTLQPEEVSVDAIFRIDFQVSEEMVVAPFAFAPMFHDELGAEWTDTGYVTLAEPTAELVVSHTELLDDGNGDGYLSPAESARIQFFVRNEGITKATDVWADLVSTSDVVVVNKCLAGVGGNWIECDLGCSCEDAMKSSKQQVEPGETMDVAVFAVDFTIAEDAPLEPVTFEVGLHDGAGDSWTDSGSVQVLSPDSKIEISSVVMLDDSNGDGYLSPAEEATIEVRAKNSGSSKALGVWAKMGEHPTWFGISNCYAANDETFSTCNSECSCVDVPEENKQTLDAAEYGTLPILQFRVNLSAETPLEPQTFQVAFGDAFGNEWTDTYTLDIVAMNALIKVHTVDLWDDTNGDGVLSPGESAKAQIKVKNVGTSMTEGLWAEIIDSDPNLDITTCYSQVGATWAKCSSDCSCSQVTSLAKQTLEPNSSGDVAILRLNMQLDLSAPVEPLSFGVRFHDAFGNSWEDSFIVDVEEYKASISVGVTELTQETNGDGFLSPGESGVITLYPRNDGEVKALGLWAKLVSVDPVVQIDNCFVAAEGTWVKCSNSCSCEGLFDSTLQDLDAGTTSEVSILQIYFTINPGAPAQPIGFGIGFYDTLGLTWTDAVVLDVVEADVDVSVASVEVIDDTNQDGKASPGEFVSFNVYAQNTGSAAAMGLWSALVSSDDKFEVDSCYMVAGDSMNKCDNSCSCHNVFESLKQSIEANQTSEDPILRLSGTVSASAQPTPLVFSAQFTDMLMNTWNDTFYLSVEDP